MVHFLFQSENESIICCQQVVGSRQKKKKGRRCLHNMQLGNSLSLGHFSFSIFSFLQKRHCKQYMDHLQEHNGWLEHPMGSKYYHSCALMPCDHLCIISCMMVGSVSQPCCSSGMGWSLVLPKSRFYVFSIDLSSFMLVLFS